MDNRITDLLHLFPKACGRRALVIGCVESSFLERLKDECQSVTQLESEEIHDLREKHFDLVSYFPKQTVLPSEIDELNRLVTDGGLVFIVLASKSNHNSIGNRSLAASIKNALIERDYLEVYDYRLSPSLDDIRLAVPVAGRRVAAASLALYQPSLRKAKLRKVLAYFLGLSGLSDFWAPDRAIIARKTRNGDRPEVLREFLGRLYGTEVNLALFTGTPGYLQKPVMQIMNTRGAIIGYGKVGDKSRIKEIIENEAFILQKLANLDLADTKVPKLEFLGDFHSETLFLIQSTEKRHFSSGQLTLRKVHTDFLFRLFDQTKVSYNFKNSNCLREVASRFQDIERELPEDWRKLLERTLNCCSAAIGNAKVQLGLAHRDFTPWNTFISKDVLFVFDWEFAKESWPPLTDAFHFIIQKSVLVDRRKPYELWNKIFSINSREGVLIRELSSRLNIDNDVLPPLLGFYLCDIATLYLKSYHRQETFDRKGYYLMACWKVLLKKVGETQGLDVL